MNASTFAVEVAKLFDKTGDMPFDEIYKLVVEKFTSTNTGSPKLPTRADFIAWLSTFESAPSACSIYDWLCRQLRAGA